MKGEILTDNQVRSLSQSELTSRLFEAEKHINELRRENALVRHDFDGLAAKFETALIFFESRIDSVYQASLVRTSGLEADPIEVMYAGEVEKRLQDLIFGGFDSPPTARDFNIKDILTGDLSAGVKKGALTLYGFRIDPVAARDLGNCIRIEAGEFGAVVFGPYKRLRPGKYKVTFQISIERELTSLAGSIGFDVFDGTTGATICAKTIHAEHLSQSFSAALNVDWGPESPNHLVEIRVFQGLNSVVFLNQIAIEEYVE